MPKRKGKGAALIAAAVTSKPFLPQRGREIKMVERDGKEVVEVPLMRQGVYEHFWFGALVFDQDFFDDIIENHANSVTDYPVTLDFRHTDQKGALAFLDAEDGGWLEQQGKWLYAYGPVLNEEAKQAIESRAWRFSSPEYHPDYRSHQLAKLEDGQECKRKIVALEKREDTYGVISFSQLKYINDKEEAMPKKFKFGAVELELEPSDEGFLLTEQNLTDVATAFTSLATQLEDLRAESEKLVARGQKLEEEGQTLRAELDELRADDGDDHDQDALPEWARVQLEEQKKQLAAIEDQHQQLQRQRLLEQVGLTIDNARRANHGGFGWTKPVLELVQNAMLGNDVTLSGGKIVKLEDGNAPVYLRAVLREVLEIGLERVPLEGHAQEDDQQFVLEVSPTSFTQEEMEEAVQDYRENY